LDTVVPLKNGAQPCIGYKILQINAETQPGEISMKSDTFVAINKAFGIPPVELHAPSAAAGGCGMFHEGDGSLGKNQIS
jgi:hypothetical protein